MKQQNLELQSPPTTTQPVMGSCSLFTIQEEVTTATAATTTKSSSRKPSSSILTRVHAGYFRITLFISCQALFWKTLGDGACGSHDLQHIFHKLPSLAFLLLWCLAFSTQALLSLLYILKCFLHIDMVKAEFKHHVGVNYLFAPWVSWLLLLQSAPWVSPTSALYVFLWWGFVVPVVTLAVKIYGQWFTTEKRFLSAVANPASQMTVIGNLVVARTAAQMGWRESALCMFSLGIVHYLVIFVTLYRRLSGASNFPATLRPVFFLSIAAPSIASLAWNSISGAFDTPLKMMFFLSLFIFASLVGACLPAQACRTFLFKKSMKQFNIAWWAYSFTFTLLALSSAEYAQEMKGSVAIGLMLIVSAFSVVVFPSLLLLTALKVDSLLWEEDDSSLSFFNESESY